MRRILNYIAALKWPLIFITLLALTIASGEVGDWSGDGDAFAWLCLLGGCITVVGGLIALYEEKFSDVPDLLRAARSARLRVVERGGEVWLVRTPGNGTSYEQRVDGPWNPRDPESVDRAQDALAAQRARDRDHDDQRREARQLAHTLDRSLRS